MQCIGLICEQEIPADAKVTRDNSVCMKAPGRNLSSAGNPTLEPNITSISKLVAKLWPFYISKMAVSRHLGFYLTGNRPFDPPTLKTTD